MAVDITATQPADELTWATDGGTRVAPTGGQKATGWTDGQRPPFNVFNWIIGIIADWIEYFEDATDELDAAKLSVNGLNGMVGDLFPTVDDAVNNGADASRWSTVWGYVADFTTKLRIAGADILTSTLLTLAATADTKTTARTNSLTTRNIIKAWGTITTDGAGGITLSDGFNISGGTPPAMSGAPKDVVITLATAMAGSYAVIATNCTTGNEIWSAWSKGATVIKLRQFLSDTGGTIDPSTTASKVDFIVIGVQ